jgi:hypothetical protein
MRLPSVVCRSLLIEASNRVDLRRRGEKRSMVRLMHGGREEKRSKLPEPGDARADLARATQQRKPTGLLILARFDTVSG